jgi:TPR repeat protein
VKAFETYRKQAENGDPKAQYELANIYATGEGVETNGTAAVEWFRKSGDQGYAPGQNGLGRMYASGLGVSKDDVEAVRWFRMAANQGLAKAQANLGLMYMRGAGVENDRSEAIKWFKKAAESGFSGGQYWLGKMYGDASIQCSQNLKLIGAAFRTWAIGHDENYPFNVSTSAGGTRELAGLGNDGFDTNAALIFQVMSDILYTPKILVCPSDSTRHPAPNFQNLLPGSVTYKVRSGTKISEVYPSEILARCPIHGHVLLCGGSVTVGVETNAAEAVKWFRKAAEQNEPAAQDQLGQMYEEGRWVPMSKEIAVEWYRKATNAGNPHAIMRLRDLFPTPEDVAIDIKSYLRQLETAKQQWALDNRKGIGDVPSEPDLKPYLSKGFPPHPPGGHFIINPIGTQAASSTYGKPDDL